MECIKFGKTLTEKILTMVDANELEETTFQTFVKYHLTICENPDLVGATAHSLDIFRKQSRVISLYSGENL